MTTSTTLTTPRDLPRPITARPATPDDEAAVRFWPAVAASFDGGWVREHRAIPGRPELPPDTWVTFATSGQPHTV